MKAMNYIRVEVRCGPNFFVVAGIDSDRVLVEAATVAAVLSKKMGHLQAQILVVETFPLDA